MKNKEQVEQIVKNIKNLLALRKTIKLDKKLGWKNIGKIPGLVKSVVKEVESISSNLKGLSGKEKQELAIDVLNRLVDLPMVPEFAERLIFGLLINMTVEYLNERFGKKWLSKFK